MPGDGNLWVGKQMPAGFAAPRKRRSRTLCRQENSDRFIAYGLAILEKLNRRLAVVHPETGEKGRVNPAMLRDSILSSIPSKISPLTFHLCIFHSSAEQNLPMNNQVDLFLQARLRSQGICTAAMDGTGEQDFTEWFPAEITAMLSGHGNGLAWSNQ